MNKLSIKMVRRELGGMIREYGLATAVARLGLAAYKSVKPLNPELGDIVRRYDLVHDEWYQKTNPDVDFSNITPVDHYIEKGFRQERSPHPLFDPEFYLGEYPDVARSGMPSIVHYLLFGGREWRPPHPAFDIANYRRHYESQIDLDEVAGAFVDFCASEDRLEAFSFFDLDYYRDFAPSAAQTPNGYLVHFFVDGLASGYDPHPLIQLDKLRSSAAGRDRKDIFLALFDATKSRPINSPHPAFDSGFYASQHENLPCHPVVHYLRNWETENVWPNAIFSTRYYRSQLDQDRIRPDPLTHYLSEGQYAGIEPNYYFDTAAYRAAYGHLFEPGEDPIVHYLKHGSDPSLEPGERFCQRYYISRNPEVLTKRIPALAHYLHTGRLFGSTPVPPAAWLDVTAGLTPEEIASQIRECARTTGKPLVSVIVPAYQNIEYTLRCLHSVVTSPDKTPFEVIVADDASPDGSGTFLEKILAGIPGIRVLVNEANLGFLRSCNAAAAKARGEYLFFLNNDTAVIDGWLDELVDTFRRTPGTGLVGSKLLYPNGLLQEAGGIVWEEGAAANFGRGDDPMRPEYNFARDADYVSGAAILVSRAAWKDVGGFSEEYAPAYYEDTDLAMKLRRAGKRVIYQPQSQVVHFEGISSGTDISKGIKRHQEINRERFSKNWKDVLATQGRKGDTSRACVDRRARARILVFDWDTPRPDRDSGSVTAFHVMSILCSLGYRVTFVPENLEWGGRHARALQRLGVEIICKPYATSAKKYLLRHGGEFDLAILSRATHGGRILNEFKALHPHVPTVFDTVDLHHLRLHRQNEQERSNELQLVVDDMKAVEFSAVQNAEATILVSSYEAKYLQDEIGPFPHIVLPLIYPPVESKSPYEKRADIAFIGGYKHPPNIDAVKYLVEEVWPVFRELKTGASLHIIGSDMPPEFAKYAADDIKIIGFVADLEDYLGHVRLTVAPLRYGAGVKGKVGNSLRLGVPCVATPVAAEGMGLEPDKNIMVGRTPEEIAVALQTAYTHEDVWTRLSDAGQKYANREFGIESARAKLAALCATLIHRDDARADFQTSQAARTARKPPAEKSAAE